MMNDGTTVQLEFDKVKGKLTNFALSYLGRHLIEQLQPLTELRLIESLLKETDEAVNIIAHGASVPLPSLDGIEVIVNKFGKGFIYTEEELGFVARLLESIVQLKRFMMKNDYIAPKVSSYALSLYELTELEGEIKRCVRHGKITDEASNGLARIRKKILITEERIKKKLDNILQKYRSYLQEYVVSMRNNRYVIPVKKEHRKLVKGAVLDESASGQTVFIEPNDLSVLHHELAEYRMVEAREESKVLSILTELTEQYRHEISINLETIGYYDFLFAKAKYARSIDGRLVELNNSGRIYIKGGKHPLLAANTVPLHFSIGDSYSALIITGPNTGGKTVSLKTIGLLTIMVQSGLLVPVQEGSHFAVYKNVLVDIGDGQSIEQSLSTFSSHINNVIRILNIAGPSTLILLDELAAGTDPGEGIGLSIAILEELYRRGSSIIATTHFNEIKKFAEITPGFQNARMEFDVETMHPLYQLTIGEAGQSYAFLIALKLGIAAEIIERSKQIAYHELNRSDQSTSFESALLPDGANTSVQPVEKKSDRIIKADKKFRNFEIGDCVWIQSLKRTGIVCGQMDAKGNVLVLIQKEKVKINRKRLSLYIERKELYPDEDYDMDIVFESKEVRKKRKLMNRKYVKDLTINQSNDEHKLK